LITEVALVETEISTGIESPFVFNNEMLNPTPNLTVVEGTSGLTSEINAYVSYSAVITGEEVLEAVNLLKDGDLLKTRISEIGVYDGVDRVINIDSNGEILYNDYSKPNINTPGTYYYTEALYSCLCYHYCDLGVALSNNSDAYDFRFKIGSSNVFLA
jgi:hypothetical protein